MYKILILYKAEHNLWQQYGTTITSSASGGKSTFTEFVTDDLDVLKEEILKLDRIYGHENIRPYHDITANFSVDIVVDDTDTTESDEDKDENENKNNE